MQSKGDGAQVELSQLSMHGWEMQEPEAAGLNVLLEQLNTPSVIWQLVQVYPARSFCESRATQFKLAQPPSFGHAATTLESQWQRACWPQELASSICGQYSATMPSFEPMNAEKTQTPTKTFFV